MIWIDVLKQKVMTISKRKIIKKFRVLGSKEACRLSLTLLLESLRRISMWVGMLTGPKLSFVGFRRYWYWTFYFPPLWFSVLPIFPWFSSFVTVRRTLRPTNVWLVPGGLQCFGVGVEEFPREGGGVQWTQSQVIVRDRRGKTHRG